MIEIFVSVLIIYLVYYFVSVRRFDKYGHVKNKKGSVSVKNDSKKNVKMSNDDKAIDYLALPSEAKYFIKKYHVDLDKVNLRGVLKVIGLILGVDIAIISCFVLLLFKSVVVQVLVASILIIPVYLISIRLLANYFKKKGLMKDV